MTVVATKVFRFTYRKQTVVGKKEAKCWAFLYFAKYRGNCERSQTPNGIFFDAQSVANYILRCVTDNPN